MKLLLIANTLGLVLAGIALTYFLVAYIRAEKKLAKYGESTIFRRVDR